MPAFDRGACDCVVSDCSVDVRRILAARRRLFTVVFVDKGKKCGSFSSAF